MDESDLFSVSSFFYLQMMIFSFDQLVFIQIGEQVISFNEHQKSIHDLQVVNFEGLSWGCWCTVSEQQELLLVSFTDEDMSRDGANR